MFRFSSVPLKQKKILQIDSFLVFYCKNVHKQEKVLTYFCKFVFLRKKTNTFSLTEGNNVSNLLMCVLTEVLIEDAFFPL